MKTNILTKMSKELTIAGFAPEPVRHNPGKFDDCVRVDTEAVLMFSFAFHDSIQVSAHQHPYPTIAHINLVKDKWEPEYNRFDKEATPKEKERIQLFADILNGKAQRPMPKLSINGSKFVNIDGNMTNGVISTAPIVRDGKTIGHYIYDAPLSSEGHVIYHRILIASVIKEGDEVTLETQKTFLSFDLLSSILRFVSAYKTNDLPPDEKKHLTSANIRLLKCWTEFLSQFSVSDYQDTHNWDDADYQQNILRSFSQYIQNVEL